MMLSQFKSYINKHQLCSHSDKILIAISGGADSVVLLNLLKNAGFNIALAHCNFTLRGQESDEDERFVRDLAKKHTLESHFITFDTKAYAKSNKISIEMAARELRYNWFSELCNEYAYTKIATGHHLNDSIETLFINLSRGTGINGITGIKPIQGKLIRPLLFATREQIEQHITKENLGYRTDSSNASNEYMRNIIRNEIIPKFKEINPSFEASMQKNIEHFKQTASIFNNQINIIKNDLVQKEGDQIRIAIPKLLKQEQAETILHEILSEYSFSLDSVLKVLECATGEPGKIFYSETHQLLVDRNTIVIEEHKEAKEAIEINTLDDFYNLPIALQANEYAIDSFKLIKDKMVACLDADLLVYPLKLRKWNNGDHFYPLGMQNKKKLSDFFIDQKLNRFAKDSTWILESDQKIVWVVGLRIDNRFKVSDKTKQVLELTTQ